MKGRNAFLLGLLVTLGFSAGCRSPDPGAATHPFSHPTPPVPSPSTAPLSERSAQRQTTLPKREVPWFTVGYSVEGRPIEAVELGRGPLRVLIIGSVHGNEPEGIALVNRLAELLYVRPLLLESATVVLVRNANPDGAARGMRTNSRGVDLNRNFPASNWEPFQHPSRGGSGTAPLSEPEVRVLVRLIEHFQPQRVVAIHSTRGDPMVNYDGPAQHLAERMSRLNGYPVRASIGYPTPGSLGNYVGRDLAIPTITLELPRGIDADSAWRENREALLAILLP